MTVILRETATDMAMIFREIEVAEKLLDDVRDAIDRFTAKDIRDAFGRRVDGLQLGIPSGDSSHWMLQVPYALAIPIIEASIASHNARLSALNEKARAELSNTSDGTEARSFKGGM